MWLKNSIFNSKSYKEDNITKKSSFIFCIANVMPYYCTLRRNKSTNYFERSFRYHLFIYLRTIRRGAVESITAAKSLLEKGHLSQDGVLMVDEMYLQKGGGVPVV